MIFRKLNFKSSRYDRPTNPYRCGEQCATGCTLGPSVNGTCPGSTECLPRKEGDRWFCSKNGEPCENGPDYAGQCCKQVYCVPQANYRLLRKTGLIWFFSFAFAFLVIWFVFSHSGKAFSPGPISSKHAVVEGMDCQQCHVSQPMMSWSAKVFHSLPAEGCVSCHSFSGKAKFAHNRTDFSEVTEISCTQCHSEHSGDDVQMPSVGNCVSCHESHVKSTALAHTKSFDLPKRQIKFEHAKHFGKYFKQSKLNLNSACNECHHPNSQQISEGVFEKTCSQCHGDLFSEGEQRVEFLSIPLIDTETLVNNNLGIGQWPQNMDDANFSPLTLAYLNNQGFSSLVKQLKNQTLDLADLSSENLSSLAQIQKAVIAFKIYLYDISVNPFNAVSKTTTPASNADINSLATLINNVFPNLQAEVEAFKQGNMMSTENSVFEPVEMFEKNSHWLIEGNKIKIEAKAHKDSFVLAWNKTLLSSENTEQVDAAKLQFFSSEEGLCVKCHQVRENKLPHFKVTPNITANLKFDHSPHLKLLANDCTQCHKINEKQSTISTDNCFSCHNQNKPQLIECQTCHAYHKKELLDLR